MQVTPTVGREWATETGIREFQNQMATDPQSFLEIRAEISRLVAGISKRSTRTVSGCARGRDANGRCLQCWAKSRGGMESLDPPGKLNRARSSSIASASLRPAPM